MEKKFVLHSSFRACGDQPQAIEKLAEGVNDGLRTQVLLGVTGSGKTFTMANVIEKVNRPTLVIAHNKTLAAQLCNELREFFPENKVEFFVSYYDYYQPEAYIPSTDTYIEKELEINDEIDKLRHSATSALCSRHDTIVVSSVSCIYGLGAPEDYYRNSLHLCEDQEIDRDEVIDKLSSIQYVRQDIYFRRGGMRVRGDVLDVFPIGNSVNFVRIEFFGDTITRISEHEAVSGVQVSSLKEVTFFPATHYVIADKDGLDAIIAEILSDLDKEEKEFLDEGKIVEAQRLRQRVTYDMEMIKEVGYCSGIENYSRYFDGRSPGTPPYTLLDFFPDDFIVFVDESHMTLPQIRGMFNGDLMRKRNLVNYGFRLKAAYDNRPLNFNEFNERFTQMICISATPAKYELDLADNVVEQIIRPTGLVDPEITVRPVATQVDDLIGELNKTIASGGRILVTTLTKRMAESLTAYLKEQGFKVNYMHTDIHTLERIQLVNGLRNGDFDVLVGINLLREGLDLPEVQLVAILDADKEGFLRSDTALIQTIGRAARNAESRVIMYADTITGSMQRAIDETERRRTIQKKYNQDNGIIPKTIKKKVVNTIEITRKPERKKSSDGEITERIEKLTGMMKVAASSLDFETAIALRDEITALKASLKKK
ncbi:MAG: excinuclease ABC subunit UvrB [Clostridia bacterium]|nr:excinuclease ABC subunit UvrB [Clostridia bacterium]